MTKESSARTRNRTVDTSLYRRESGLGGSATYPAARRMARLTNLSCFDNIEKR